jgi:hypothetical protein
MDEEELMSIKEQEKYVEVLHYIGRFQISIHASVGLSGPQTFNIVGYIKKKRFIVLIDSGSLHNFIDKILA